jgi:hypothetical protein
LPSTVREAVETEPNAPAGQRLRSSAVAPTEPLGLLRGAVVSADTQRVVRGIVVVLLAALAAVVALLYAAGAQRNSQIQALRDNGVGVRVTVTGCSGLMGGSGSNLAGYSCKGTLTLDGRRYEASIPGDALRERGTTMQAVADRLDPTLISTPRLLAAEHASWTVFVLPTALLVVLLGACAAFVTRTRRVPSTPRGT